MPPRLPSARSMYAGEGSDTGVIACATLDLLRRRGDVVARLTDHLSQRAAERPRIRGWRPVDVGERRIRFAKRAHEPPQCISGRRGDARWNDAAGEDADIPAAFGLLVHQHRVIGADR